MTEGARVEVGATVGEFDATGAGRQAVSAVFAERERQRSGRLRAQGGVLRAVSTGWLVQRPFGRPRSRSETPLEKIAASWRFPVDHFTGDINPGKAPDHEIIVKLAPTHAPSGGDRFGQRARFLEREHTFLRGGGQGGKLIERARRRAVSKQCMGRPTQPPAPARLGGEVALHPMHLAQKLFDADFRFEVDLQNRGRHPAELGAEAVKPAAFEAVAGNQELAARLRRARANGDILERLTFRDREQLGRPGAFPAAIGRLQWRNGDSERLQRRDPAGVRTGLRPRAAAEREDDGVCFDRTQFSGVIESEGDGWPRIEPEPSMPHGDFDAEVAQPVDPAA